jgi:hypothetical protein
VRPDLERKARFGIAKKVVAGAIEDPSKLT